MVYLVAEGVEGFRRRVVAARGHLNAWGAPFALIAAAPNLGAAAGDADTLVASIRAHPFPSVWSAGVVVIDTVARVTAGIDENSARDVGIFVANADKIARELNCLVLLVHHSGKNADAGMRGSSALLGAADAVWAISNDNGVRTVALAKSKDAADGLTWNFTLEPVVIGEDAEGEPISTCVVKDMTAPTFTTGRKSAKPSPPPSQRLFVAALDEALIASGADVRPYGHGGATVRAVRRETIREIFFGAHPADTENAKRVAFNRALNAAASSKLVIAADVVGVTYVWRA